MLHWRKNFNSIIKNEILRRNKLNTIIKNKKLKIFLNKFVEPVMAYAANLGINYKMIKI